MEKTAFSITIVNHSGHILLHCIFYNEKEFSIKEKYEFYVTVLEEYTAEPVMSQFLRTCVDDNDAFVLESENKTIFVKPITSMI